MVERVTAGLNLKLGNRFLVLYGQNTNDTFCSKDLLLQNIEQVLHRYFHSHDYQRILYYSGVQKLYFLDEHSRNLSRLQPKNAADTTNKQMHSAGPLGRKRGLLGKKSTPPEVVSTAPTQNRRLQDIQILPILETVMQDTTQKSAIIFSHAEDLANFDNRRELFGRIVNWSRLPPNNQNLCILVFHHENREQLQEFCRYIGFTFLANLTINEQAKQETNFHRLSSPTKSEITALCEYFRLKYQKSIDWSTITKLSSWIAAENKKLNYWFECFNTAPQKIKNQRPYQINRTNY